MPSLDDPTRPPGNLHPRFRSSVRQILHWSQVALFGGAVRQVNGGEAAANTTDVDLFDWRVYADATCAGLSVLIPLPLLDLIFETVFRRRIPGSIAKARERRIEPPTRVALARPLTGPLSVSGCLAIPIKIVRYILRRLWRKIIYVFAVADATTALTEYWCRAFLIDHMARAGHLAPGADTELAVRVFRDVLNEIDPSPLASLARQTMASAHHVLRLLVRARRMGAAEVTKSLGEVLASHWKAAESALHECAELYNETYRAEVAARERRKAESVVRIEE